MNDGYWLEFYKEKFEQKPSSFAEWILPYVKGDLVDLGCGNGRDLNYFLKHKIKAIGVDEAFKSNIIAQTSISKYMKVRKSPKNVYARFFWHSIPRELQLAILKWTSGYIFIEARTTEDKFRPKVFKKHERNFVDVAQLVKDLKDNDFEIISLKEGTGFSKYKSEDPHLVRVIARK